MTKFLAINFSSRARMREIDHPTVEVTNEVLEELNDALEGNETLTKSENSPKFTTKQEFSMSDFEKDSCFHIIQTSFKLVPYSNAFA